jgi:hypothetical protein
MKLVIEKGSEDLIKRFLFRLSLLSRMQAFVNKVYKNNFLDVNANIDSIFYIIKKILYCL